MKRKTALFIYFSFVFAIVGLDLWTKEAAFEFLKVEVIPAQSGIRAQMRPVHAEEYVVVESYFNLQSTLNYGAFSGMFAGKKWLLLGVSSLWVLGTLVFVCWQSVSPRLLVFGLSLTAGGALGNLYDRYFIGAVRDFIKWFVVIGGEEKVWPNFNIADAAICVGVSLILIQEFRRPKVTDESITDDPTTVDTAKELAGAETSTAAESIPETSSDLDQENSERG